MRTRKRNRRLSDLLPRDSHRCGIHVGGCGMPIRNRAEVTVDHIFTQSFFRDREDGVRPKDYDRNWNLQPMHQKCNNDRGGQIYGFPLFLCSCHWLQIEKTTDGHVLNMHHRNGKDDFVFVVSSEEHNFVFKAISPSRFAHEFGGVSKIEVAGVWSMGNVPPGKEGITGPGELGHAFPRISPDEIAEFNRLEIRRVRGISSQTIEKFNLRLETARQWVHFEVVE